ncbi:MAG: CDP-glycerol glycerophosphotransferase family protein [bacterium]|nr:CDP-glycerol glycerophosphotransferase family protein [bacterium]
MINKIKKIKLKDFLSIFIFLVALPLAVINKISNRKKPIWLVCELKNTAHDNGYHFFKYIRNNHPEINCFYAIDKKCLDYYKVADFGNVIQFGSLKHWVYYLSAEYNISSHKEGNPNHALFTFLHLYLHLFNNRVFLQHGITKDDAKMFYYKNTYFKYFVCGAKREYEFIKEKFGYPQKSVIYTGLARFDNLYDNCVDKKKILVIPTWRRWFETSKDEDFFKNSAYFNNWNNFLNNANLIKFIEENNVEIVFFPHYGVRKFSHLFKFNSKNITMINDDIVDLQKLLKESSLMITDYSSVYMDFAYMRKPIIYYQFDYDEYRKSHFEEGYFSYIDDGFGSVIKKEDDLVNKLKKYYYSDYTIEKKYINRMEQFFELHDANNCSRIFNVLINDSKYN